MLNITDTCKFSLKAGSKLTTIIGFLSVSLDGTLIAHSMAAHIRCKGNCL